jgi:hypothetical protein
MFTKIEQMIWENPIFKITRAKWTRSVAQAVELMLCKWETPVRQQQQQQKTPTFYKTHLHFTKHTHYHISSDPHSTPGKEVGKGIFFPFHQLQRKLELNDLSKLKWLLKG